MRKMIIAAILSLIAVSASAATVYIFNRNQVVWMSPLFGVGGAEVLPYTTYYIQDKQNPNTCLFVLVDNATKHFTTTAVHYASCPIVYNSAFLP